jgi:PhnB protein
MSTVNPVPAGYRTLTPYLAVKDGQAALDFYRRGLGAEVVDAMDAPGGGLMHAELRIGDSMLQLSDDMPDYGLKAPEQGWVHSSVVVYVEDSDAFVDRAVREGATLVSAVADTFSGDRHGVFLDPFGHRWAVCTKVEDVPAEEVARRARELFYPAAGVEPAERP